MVAIYPTATGAYSTRTWNVCATGLAYGLTPQVGDDLYANNTTCTLDTSIHVNSLNNASNGSAAAGGSFTVSATGLTSTVDGSITAGTASCFACTVGAGNSHTLNGTALAIAGSAATTNSRGVSFTGIGTLNITGSGTGGGASGAHGIYNSSSGTINVTGNVTGSATAAANGIVNNTSGVLTVSGTALGAASAAGLVCGAGTATVGASTGGAGFPGCTVSSGTLTVTGATTGGSAAVSYGVSVTGAATVNLNTVTGGSNATAYGAFNASTGIIIASGQVAASSTTPAIADVITAAGFIQCTGPIVNSTGINALFVAHLCLTAAADWTIAIAGTPPAYNGTVTIGAKGGIAGGKTVVQNIGTY